MRPTHEALDELVETAHAQREDDPATNQAFHETHTRALTASLAGAALLGAAGGAVLRGRRAGFGRRSQRLQRRADSADRRLHRESGGLHLQDRTHAALHRRIVGQSGRHQVRPGDHGAARAARRRLQCGGQEPRWQGAEQPRSGLRPRGQEGGGRPRLRHAGPGGPRRRGAGPRAREHRRRDLRQGHGPGQEADEQGAAGQRHGHRGAGHRSPPSWPCRPSSWRVHRS